MASFLIIQTLVHTCTGCSLRFLWTAGICLMQTVFSYLSFFIFLSQNFFPEQMVAWCQETNGSIPQSQLLQVRKRRKWISDTAKSVLAHIKNLCVTLLQLNDHFSGFKQLLKCILMSCDSKEAALLKHERHSGLKNSFSRWSSAFFPPLYRISWIPAAVQRSRASFIWKKPAASPGKSSTCSCAVLDCTALLKECQRQASL